MTARVEILYFEGCPNHEPAFELVTRVAGELRLEPSIELVGVPDGEAAARLRFLGSPTVRVDGHDVEDGAEARTDFALSCRVYRSEQGASGQPDEAWIRQALLEAPVSRRLQPASREHLPSPIADILAAAAIPTSKLGFARHAGLTSAERQLYFWILRRFASHGRPSGAEAWAEAERLGLDVAAVFARLAQEDLVHGNESGELTVAYPFSGSKSGHRVRFPSGHRVYAMCALDALGIAPMFGTSIEIESRDPVSGEKVRARVAPEGTVDWSPEEAVVVTGAIRSGDDACCGCCRVLNLFASATTAERWLAAQPEVQGYPISVADAAAAGRTVFGEVFSEG